MLDILFFNVGHGDSIALRFPDKTWGIIDCNKYKNQTEPNVLKFLKENNINSLRFICLTHPHKDHFLGLFDVINYCDKVENLILYGLNTGCRAERNKRGIIYKTIINFLNDKKMPTKNIILARNKGIYNINSKMRLEFLSPTEDIVKNYVANKIYKEKKSAENCLSVIIKIFYKNKTILLCADAQKENWALLEDNVDADIIKISHHGSYQNNKSEYLEKVINAKGHISIISSDGGELYKSIPSKRVINYLENMQNALVFKTYDFKTKTSRRKLSSKSLLAVAGLESASRGVAFKKYDGAIKLSIDDNGKINKQTYNSVDEIKI